MELTQILNVKDLFPKLDEISVELDKIPEDANEQSSPWPTAFEQPREGLERQEFVTYEKQNGIVKRTTVVRTFYKNDYVDTSSVTVI